VEVEEVLNWLDVELVLGNVEELLLWLEVGLDTADEELER
jgi:hypothetical protein